ncbi:MAG: hypothetical protein ACYTGB_15455, partial [Planctomycetota bacterium]
EAGDGRSATHRVEVVDRPRAEEITASYHYPVYTRREPELGPPGRAAVSALTGTRVRLRARLNQPVSGARLVLDGQPPLEMKLESAGDRHLALGEFTVARSGHYRIELETEHVRTDGSGAQRRFRFAGASAPKFRVRAEPDKVPDVRLTEPGRDMNVLPEAVVAIAAEATDDYGIAGARLRWSLSGNEEEKGSELPSSGFGTTAAALGRHWDLAELKLKPGQTLSYRVTARDFRPVPGPNVGSSQVYHLRVISRETFEGEKAGARERIRRAVAEVLRMETGNRGQVDSLREDLLGGSPFNTRARTDAATAESEQRAIGRRTAAIAADVDRLLTRMDVNRAGSADEDRELGGISSKLRGLSGEKMPAAADSIRDGRNADGEKARTARFGEASTRQKEIIDVLRDILRRTEKWKESDELLRLARALLARQRKITGNTVTAGRSDEYRAAKVAALPREAKNRLEFLRRCQVGAAGDMAVLEEKMVSALARLSGSASGGNVAAALRIARDMEASGAPDAPTDPEAQSVEAAMSVAAADIIGLRLGLAAGRQTRVVGALERIACALSRRGSRDRDAADRDLRGVRGRIDEALRRENDHIADTGKLPGAEGGGKAGPGSPARGKPSAAAERIRREQERTRAMAEVIRKELERIAQRHGMPRMNRTADRAGSASSSMSQAEGHLGRGQPGSAKDDEEDARDDLQRMRREVDDEISDNRDDRHREELFRIEKELKEILAKHNEVVLGTLEVEKARRAAEGRLGRPQKARLFAASKTETEILGRARALVKQLTDSPVFRWVLDDTAGDMDEVCRELGRERTGIYVQDVERDVKRNLEELIAALKEERSKSEKKPPKGPPPDGGSPPPGGKPPLVPPLAELKMIRSMQTKVNRKTAWVDEAVSRTQDRKLSAELRRVLERTAQKQAEVAGVTGDLARMLERPGKCIGPFEERGVQ